MTQIEYDITPLKAYLKSNPNASNDDLYSICNATTTSQKGYVRKKKSRFLTKKEKKKTQEIKTFTPGSITSITPESIENIILMRLDGQLNHITDSLVRSAVDFLIKVKMGEAEGMEELDMEAFLKFGQSQRQTESS